MSRVDEHTAFQGRLVLSLQGHSSLSSEKGDPLSALSSQIGTQLKEELFILVAITLLTKSTLSPHLLSLPDGLCAQASEGSLNEYLTFYLRTAGSVTSMLAQSERNPPRSFALHYLIFSANSESVKTKNGTFWVFFQ